MTIARNIEKIIAGSSWIRKMFEEGARLKAEHGAENVYDFSLGNPNLDPPDEFYKALRAEIETKGSMRHGYMPNPGYPEVRRAVAEYLSSDYDVDLAETDVIMTCGAAGALNVALKTILDPGDEVITPAPFFVEYGAYVGNHGGVLKTVNTNSDFTLDIDAIGAAVTEKTKAVLINSPNNPTGQIYSEESLKALGALLVEKGKAFNRTIYLLSDEPYRKIVYDGVQVPSFFNCFKESILASSYSKDLSIPGERIGFAVVHPEARYRKELAGGMTLANRILGFVNAPGMMQRVVGTIQGAVANVNAYAHKRDLICNGLVECGYEFIKPPGAFYLFPKSPIPDDVEFVKLLQQELILAVPGSGFGGPGHFRLAFCVDDDTIVNAMPGFKKVIDQIKA
jgi:aspartate aminotransferase